MRTKLPPTGLEREAIFTRMNALCEGDADWRRGRVPLYVFKGDEHAAAVGRDAFIRFFDENGLGGKRAFHGLKRMEDEVIEIGLSLFRAPQSGIGYFTTGGTESIIAVVKACRDFARRRLADRERRGNIVLPYSAHPAFTKAAILMDLITRRIPVGADWRADVAAMAQAIDDDTLMIVGSAPCFPYGVIDPIQELGRIAEQRNLWLHVDACVGGYLAPFVAKAGYAIPDFDFSVAGVTSLSADLHKFGFCPKPASTIFYRSPEQAACQPFEVDEWPAGRFATATLVGTRPGGAIAGAWATLHAMGERGYVETAARLMKVVESYREGIEDVGFSILGEPELTILAFTCAECDMQRVSDGMARRGWVPGVVRNPPGMHLMLSMLHAPARDQYVGDLARSLEDARTGSAHGTRADDSY
ncbi:MAG TPA: aminotransferase class V-fold PLP-dependent enzyme [Casimicrobiaceae bacterium]|nr:aminotransferase class V-fold PLP-dependent enzyme [Casimicrobiaceae bacterium]